MKKSTKQKAFAAVYIVLAVAFAFAPVRDGVEAGAKAAVLLCAGWATFYTGALFGSHRIDEITAGYLSDDD